MSRFYILSSQVTLETCVQRLKFQCFYYMKVCMQVCVPGCDHHERKATTLYTRDISAVSCSENNS